jgi:peptidoglycan/LPS O-acetylase OafA/YrhL
VARGAPLNLAFNMPASRPQLKALTGLRYFAALAVLLFHYGRVAHLPWLFFSFGHQAVSLFFILSGLVLTYAYHETLAGRSINWKGFMNRRLARIIPLHVVSFLFATYVYWDLEPKGAAAISWLANFLCVQIYWPAASIALHWNAPSWSISCELFFYALFPLLFIWLNSVRKLISVIVVAYAVEALLYIAAAACLSHGLHADGSVMGFRNVDNAFTNILPLVPVIRLGEFVIGICLGLLIVHRRANLFRDSRALRDAVVVLALVGAVVLQRIHLEKWGSIALHAGDYLLYVPLFALLIVALASGRTILSAILENPVIVLLGEASYSLYLLHYPLGEVLLGSRSPWQYFIAFVCANLLAVASFWYVERPLMNLWRGRMRQPPVAQTALEQSQF